MKKLLLAVVLIVASAASSFASDHTNLEENLPTELEDAYVVEAGFRRQLTPFTLATLGAGAGFGADSENYRVTLGFQHAF